MTMSVGTYGQAILHGRHVSRAKKQNQIYIKQNLPLGSTNMLIKN